MGKKQSTKDDMVNDLTYKDYLNRLESIALSLFEWEGLPPSCNVRFLEKTLYEYGIAIFVNDEDMGYLNLRCMKSGEINIYLESVSYTAFSVNYTKSYMLNECVLIRNNYIERPTLDSLMLFASRLTNAERTIDVNINSQKTPVVVACDDNDLLTMQNAYKDIDGNVPVLFVKKGLNLEAIKVLKTDAPFVADKVMVYKRDIWNEAMTFLGVNSANTEKRERLITDEVNANNEQININAETMLLTRQEACKKINEMYGLNVSVKMRELEEVKEEVKEDNTNE